MTKIFLACATILALICTAAVIAHPNPENRTITPTRVVTTPPSVSYTQTEVPLPAGLTTGMQSDGTCIHCGPGDNVCKAPGDCGYGDNPGSKDDGIPNNDDH